MSRGNRPTRLWLWDLAAAGLLLAYIAGLVGFCWAALTGSPRSYADPRGWWPVALQLLLGLAAFGAYYLPRRHETRSFSLLVTGGLGISTIVLGVFGSWSCAQGESPFFAPVAIALGLLVGATPTFTGECAGQPYPLALQVGRLLGPLLLVITALGIVATIFRAQLDRLLVRFARSLVVVVGLSDDAVPLLRRLARNRPSGTTLAVLAEPTDHPLTALVRTMGARLVLCDLADTRGLRTLTVRNGRFKVKELHVVSSNESANLACARQFRTLADTVSAGRPDIPPLISARLDDLWQAEHWRRTNAYRTPPPEEVRSTRWVSDALSVYEVTASILVAHARHEQHERLAVVGSSPLALAVCSELAQCEREAAVLHLEHIRPSMAGLVLVGPGAEGLLEQHRIRQERFGNSAHTWRIAVEPAVPSKDTLAGLLGGQDRCAIVLADDPGATDTADLSPSLLAALHPNWTIYYPDANMRGLAPRPVMPGLLPFGLTIEAAAGGAVGSWERAARVVHQSFLNSLDRPDPDRPAQRPWEDLAPFYRESNVRLITATLAGAESVGRTWGPEVWSATGPPSTAIEPAQLAAMAEFEHTTWRQFYLDVGWRNGAERDDARRVHNALRPWDELSPAYRERTAANVRDALRILHALGYRSWTRDERRPWVSVARRGEVQATVLKAGWRWQTASGEWLNGRVGDYRVSNGTGNAWTVDPDIFVQTHEHLHGDRWRRTGQVWAQPAVTGELVVTLEGPTTASEGDWVIRGAAGEQWLTAAEHFAENYAPVGAESG